MSNPLRNRRITLADVGKRCGYHGTTVGLALKNHPRIPEPTREKIKAVAQEMGYKPDPSLSSLIAYRRSKVNYRFNSKIALVTDIQDPKTFVDDGNYGHNVLNGIRDRSSELGYEIEFFCVGFDREKEKQVDRILKARGINAIIIFGLERVGVPIHLTWDNFSLISIGYSHPNPKITRVTTKNRWASFKCVQELHQRGYRRPVLVMPKDYDLRVDRGWSAGFLSACYEFGIPVSGSLFLPEIHQDSYNENLIRYIDQQKPDAIITTGRHLFAYMVDKHFKIPKDLAFVCLDNPYDEQIISGVCQNPREVGRQAVTLLSNLQVNNVRGLAKHEYIHLVSGSWIEGTTAPPRNSLM